jgi:pilus assembly protein CpaB
VVGKTATLELRPEQAEMLTRARQAGTLSLALRSLADAAQPGTAPDSDGKTNSMNVVRFGVPMTMTTRK